MTGDAQAHGVCVDARYGLAAPPRPWPTAPGWRAATREPTTRALAQRHHLMATSSVRSVQHEVETGKTEITTGTGATIEHAHAGLACEGDIVSQGA